MQDKDTGSPSGRANRRIVNARMKRAPKIINPVYGTAAGPTAHAEVYAPDGFGCDIKITAECSDGPYGGNDHPQLAVRMEFTQQHAAEIHDSDGLPLIKQSYRTYPPTVTLHAWGCEANEFPHVLRRAADAAEAALKLNADRAEHSED